MSSSVHPAACKWGCWIPSQAVHLAWSDFTGQQPFNAVVQAGEVGKELPSAFAGDTRRGSLATSEGEAATATSPRRKVAAAVVGADAMLAAVWAGTLARPKGRDFEPSRTRSS